MDPILECLQAIEDFLIAKRQYDRERAQAVRDGDVSWDWSGRAFDEVEDAKTAVADTFRAALREEVHTIISEGYPHLNPIDED